MPINDVYADIVELYDLEHIDFNDDVEFLLELAELGDDPILELGCGTGRILFPLADAGHIVVGIDSSQPMLRVVEDRKAHEPTHTTIEIQHGDMADLDAACGGPFGMIIASLNSIMHLTCQERQRQMISSAWRSLKPGGRLVIDTLNPGIAQLNHLLNRTHLEGSWTTAKGVTIDKWGHRQAGDDSQIIDTLIWYDHLDVSGEFRRVRTRFDLRYVHQSELSLMLDATGFTHVDWYGGYELDAWHADSDRIIAVAHKEDE